MEYSKKPWHSRSPERSSSYRIKATSPGRRAHREEPPADFALWAHRAGLKERRPGRPLAGRPQEGAGRAGGARQRCCTWLYTPQRGRRRAKVISVSYKAVPSHWGEAHHPRTTTPGEAVLDCPELGIRNATPGPRTCGRIRSACRRALIQAAGTARATPGAWRWVAHRLPEY